LISGPGIKLMVRPTLLVFPALSVATTSIVFEPRMSVTSHVKVGIVIVAAASFNIPFYSGP